MLHVCTVYLAVLIMLWRSGIIPAFYPVIHVEPSDRRVVTTGEFVRQLAAVNFNGSQAQANDWIKSIRTISAIPLRTMLRISSGLCSTPTELIMGFVSLIQDNMYFL